MNTNFSFKSIFFYLLPGIYFSQKSDSCPLEPHVPIGLSIVGGACFLKVFLDMFVKCIRKSRQTENNDQCSTLINNTVYVSKAVGLLIFGYFLAGKTSKPYDGKV